MVAMIFPIGSLLLGTAFLLLGTGLLNTLLALRGSIEAYSDPVLGLIMSGYFIGFFFGTFLALPMIRRIGHIRTFASCAALLACFSLLHAILIDSFAWFVLRVATGIVLVSLYTVIESWLNGQTPAEQRGRVFAIYMVVNLSALAASQGLLVFASPSTFILFSVTAIFICVSLVPVTWTRMSPPELQEVSRIKVRRIRKLAPVAIAAVVFSGFAMGAFWGLAPVYAERIGLEREAIAWFVSITILGGVLLQYPLGRYSDSHDRRKVIFFSSFIATVAALVMAALSFAGPWVMLAALLYGSMAFATYPLAVAHLMDHLENDEILGGGSTLLLLYGLASAVGPALAGVLMGYIGAQALPLFFAATQACLVLYIVFRLSVRKRLDPDSPSPFVAMVRTTPTVLEMLPEDEQVQESLDLPEP